MRLYDATVSVRYTKMWIKMTDKMSYKILYIFFSTILFLDLVQDFSSFFYYLFAQAEKYYSIKSKTSSTYIVRT